MKLHAFRHVSRTRVDNIALTLTFNGRKYVEFEDGDLNLNIDVPGYLGNGVRVVWDRTEQANEPGITYSSGGYNNYERDYSNIQRARNFAAAMDLAAQIAAGWVGDGWGDVFDSLYELSNEKVTPQ
jgi:hypothetical protein